MEMTLGPTYSEKGSISAVNRPIAIKTSAQLSQRPALGANKLRAILSIDGIFAGPSAQAVSHFRRDVISGVIAKPINPWMWMPLFALNPKLYKRVKKPFRIPW